MAAVAPADYASHLPGYLDALPCAKHIWADVTDAIKTARTAIQRSHDGEEVELELRFRLGPPVGHFQPGVPDVAFAAVEARLDSGRDWARVDDWHNVHVAFHGSSVPGDARRIRTSVRFPPTQDDADDPVAAWPEIQWIQKEVVQNRDFRTVALGVHSDGNPAELRVALNIERDVGGGLLPDDTETTAFHVKERKCYYYAPTGCTAPVWCYMLTRRWTGGTFREAQTAKDQLMPVHEIEIECVDPSYLLSKDPGKTAVKLLGKACDLLGIMVAEYQDHTAFIMEPSAGPMLWARGKNRQ